MRIRSLVLSAALLALPFPLMADTIYTYTGNDFTSFSTFNQSQVYSSNDSVSVEFTLSAPLAASLVNALITPASFNFSDGYQSITDATSAFDWFEITTDADGNIAAWDVFAENDNGEVNTTNEPAAGIVNDIGASETGVSDAVGQNDNSPGIWTESTADPIATPEPASLFLAATGLLGVAGVIRRRRVLPS
jgi:hypothetical protein